MGFFDACLIWSKLLCGASMAKVGYDLDHTVMQFAFFVSVMLAEQWLMWSYTLPGTAQSCLPQTYRGTAVKKSLLGVA